MPDENICEDKSVSESDLNLHKEQSRCHSLFTLFARSFYSETGRDTDQEHAHTKCSNIGPGFLANVNSRSRSLYAIARPSVVCLSSVVGNVRAPYSGGSDFRQYFYGIRYLGHPWTSTENFTEIVPGEPLRRGS